MSDNKLVDKVTFEFEDPEGGGAFYGVDVGNVVATLNLTNYSASSPFTVPEDCWLVPTDSTKVDFYIGNVYFYSASGEYSYGTKWPFPLKKGQSLRKRDFGGNVRLYGVLA